MGLFYLLAGIAVVIALHFIFQWFLNAKPSRIRRFLQWGAIIGVIAVILILLRVGLPAIAALFSGFLALTALLNRLLIWFPIARWLGSRYGGKRTAGTTASAPAMTIKEAREILGVDEHATREDIKAAHKKLMRKVHPDQGGSDYFAGQLNRARDMLLKHTKQS